MTKKRKQLPQYKNIEVLDTGSTGKAIARIDNQVVFIPFVVPGDIIDVQITKRKKSYMEGKAIKINKKSSKRTEPVCEHFGLCGGCKWQNMEYKHQIFYKQKQVEDAFYKIANIKPPFDSKIIPSENIFYYRNKLDFTFSNNRWLTGDDQNRQEKDRMKALGFHLPGMFDRVLDINKCHLQKDPSNYIRLALREYALQHDYSFYDIRSQTGFLRNVIIRTSSTDQVMVILVLCYEDKEKIYSILDDLIKRFPEITSLYYVINGKKNDDISDLSPVLFYGTSYISEEMPCNEKSLKKLTFRVGPLSFYQTNSQQAYKLYKITKQYSALVGKEIVYDLYTGTGTIANYLSSYSKKVIGIEYLDSATKDAKANARLNQLKNTYFFAGDILKVLNNEFLRENGQPDIIVSDPPRAGMHPKVINKILEINPEKIVYISCNPATQARDIALLKDKYEIIKMQPIDMFPHTRHLENIALLHSFKIPD